ncbi:hypothetical protein RintRC_3224 [Richelia intracellularis]|nr:hypothetical protein RintRC_3224 [Richelia intracellularis]
MALNANSSPDSETPNFVLQEYPLFLEPFSITNYQEDLTS